MPVEIAAWRRSERERLLALRRGLSSDQRSALATAVLINLGRVFDQLTFNTLGIYWPIQREIDIRPMADALCRSNDRKMALPVVVQKGAPLEYWQWRLGDAIVRGFWNIPVPKRREPVQPDVVVAPLVGFQAGYRLGYGGGYFDRTLGASKPRPYAIGLGFEFSRLDRFIALPHDIPMDAIVTEKSIEYRSLSDEIDREHR